MRFPRALLLAATAALGACGGDDAPGGSAQGGNSAGAPADAFELSSTSVTFEGSQGGSYPATQIVTAGQSISAARTITFSTSHTGTMFVPWVDATRRQLFIYPAAPTEAGSFTGTITVNACSNASGPCSHFPGSPKTINVTYNVLGLSVTPKQLTFSSTDPVSQTANVAITAGSPWYTQQVTYSPSGTNWLQIRPGEGWPNSSTQTLTFSANAQGLSAGVYSATVTLSTTPSFSTPVTVTFFVGDPSVNFVAPYVVPAGVTGNVIIRGRGFSALRPESLSVQFNSTPATNAVVVSDTEIHATYPSLGAGSYSIAVGSGATSIPSRAALKLVVIDPPALALTAIRRPATAGRPSNLIYDAERQAVLFIDRERSLILRYAFAGSWSAISSSGPVAGIALSPDGTELIKTGEGMLISRLDPVTLAVLSTVDTSASLGSNPLSSIAFANDGGAIGHKLSGSPSLYRYDMLARAVSPVSLQPHMLVRQVFASADGDKVVLPYYQTDNTDKRVFIYDSSTGTLAPRPVTTSAPNALSMSRDASRMIVVNDSSPAPVTIYDADFNALGTLPNGASPFVLSPGGNVAYAYDAPHGIVRKFDVSARGVTEVGTGSEVAPPNSEMSEMTISPDGGTLFLVGTIGLVVAPAP